MSSIKDVAKMAGVGVGTVSRMINDSGYVADDTKEKIRIAMDELGYIPNELGRNLLRRRTGIIAVLIPSISNPFFSQFVEFVEVELKRLNYKTMICNAMRAENNELEFLDMLDRHMVDGIITGVHSLDENEYKRIKKPIVALDRYLSDDIPVVAVDHRLGGRIAAEVLIKAGCKRVLQFRGSMNIKAPYLDRHDEFSKVMKQNGIEVIEYDLAWNRFEMSYYMQVIDDIFEREINFDGVFGVDELAILCINELFRMGKKIPEDVKVIGYDGTFVSRLVRPELTCIEQPIEELAKKTVDVLEKCISGKKIENNNIVCQVRLREGGTV